MPRPKQIEVTEELVASVLPIGEGRSTMEMMADLDLDKKVTSKSFVAGLRTLKQEGFLTAQRFSNRLTLWFRTREPSSAGMCVDQRRVCGVTVEQVTLDGRHGHFGTIEDSAPITMRAMPELKSIEVST